MAKNYQSSGTHKTAVNFKTNSGVGADVTSTTTTAQVNEMAGNTVLHALANVDANILLFLTVYAVLGFYVCSRPQIFGSRKFYKPYFASDGWMWWMINPTSIDWWSRCIDGLLAYSVGNYFYNYRNPVTQTDINFYVGIMSFFIIIGFFKWMVRDLFYNNYANWGVFVFCLFLNTLYILLHVVNLGLIGGQGTANGLGNSAWGSFGALLIVSLWELFVFGFRIYVYRAIHVLKLPQSVVRINEAPLAPKSKIATNSSVLKTKNGKNQ
jgi:hypothetical protein